jgi:hypothetical protein
MNELETRLRQELQDLAQRVAPADLRPLPEPRGGRRIAVRWMAPVAAMAAIALVAGGVALARHDVPAPVSPSHERAGRPADPPYVALAGESSKATHQAIRLISPVSGQLVKQFPRIGTGNGFAVSPDGRSVFVVQLARRVIGIDQISVGTGKVTFLAPGAYPAVSPDSRHLAYATGRRFTEIAVRDLRTGTTRVIGLSRQMGPGGEFLNQGTVLWLGSRELLAVPGIEAIAASAGAPARSRAAAAGCAKDPGGGGHAGLCAFVIRVGPRGLSDREIVLPSWWANGIAVQGPDLARPGSFLRAATGWKSAGSVSRLTVSGSRVTARQIAPLPEGAMPVAIAPDGDRVLYLVGHTPPALWVASIRNGRLTGQHLLYTDNSRFGIGDVAW